MDEALIKRLEDSFNLLAPRGEELVDRFYGNLFAGHAEVRPMFPDNIADQRKKLLASLVLVVKNLRTPQKLVEPLKELGRRHAGYDVQPEHYPVVRSTLVGVMADMAGEQWSQQLTQDWNAAIDFVAKVMLEGHDAEAAAGSTRQAAA